MIYWNHAAAIRVQTIKKKAAAAAERDARELEKQQVCFGHIFQLDHLLMLHPEPRQEPGALQVHCADGGRITARGQAGPV